ncbi:cell division protein SepF [Paenisporosarcina cavernae]|uniref:Cell division protein SepF n=1 Tax=Paenisporosarcina cavernae TaxID=2320858 RepID=A0A385YUC7_9BACL|nr:cell division protein SepF [Paenisporosarcina cavernae]AYC29172.1 cell division protein SepF [Paenisporosarcina cavernae]
MSIKNKIKNFFYLDEEEDGYDPEPVRETPVAASTYQSPVKKSVKERRVSSVDQAVPNLVSLQNAQKSSKVILVEPRVYAEAQDISEHLKNKRSVVVNLQRIDKDQGIRIVDFLSGTVYALGGDIQRIGTDIFLCAPDTVEVAGAISDYYYEDL